MRNIQQYLILIIIAVCLHPDLMAQDDKEKPESVLFAASGYEFPYDLQKPEISLNLPKDLIEISGLSWISPGKLACIQDEDGIIFVYDLMEEAITEEIQFEDEGDYEGIELIGEDAWILKSNGNLYRVSDWKDQEKRSTKKYETDLSKKNDCEGLGYDPDQKCLLIACKGFPHLEDKEGSSKKAVYQFDPNEKELFKNPRFVIDLDQIKYYKKYNTMTSWGVEILSMIDESKGDVSFQPSAIAVHPLSGNIYIIGAVGDLIIVLHPLGEILAMIELPPTQFRQPEGICFDPEGNLYISNEGKESKATLMKFHLTK